MLQGTGALRGGQRSTTGGAQRTPGDQVPQRPKPLAVRGTGIRGAQRKRCTIQEHRRRQKFTDYSLSEVKQVLNGIRSIYRVVYLQHAANSHFLKPG